MVSKSKYYEDFYAGYVLVYVSISLIYQHTRCGPSGYCTIYIILLAYYRKGDGILQEDGILKEGNIREREILEGSESSTGRL